MKSGYIWFSQKERKKEWIYMGFREWLFKGVPHLVNLFGQGEKGGERKGEGNETDAGDLDRHPGHLLEITYNISIIMGLANYI